MTKKFFQKQFVDLLTDFMYVNLKEKESQENSEIKEDTEATNS